MVCGGLTLALLNRVWLTPAHRRRDAGAGSRLARAIRIEFVLLVLVFFAASELVSVHPNPPLPSG
jgi:copper resistance protein D